MGVELAKGQKVELAKKGKSLSKITVGLGWKVRSTAGDDFDLDASIFALKDTGKVPADEWFVFYNNDTSPGGSIHHNGDNKVGGDGANDDEQITVDLTGLPRSISRLVIAVTIHEADKRQQSFGMVGKAYVRVVDDTDGSEMVRYDLSDGGGADTAMVFAEILWEGGTWKMVANSHGSDGGLYSLCRSYGVNV